MSHQEVIDALQETSIESLQSTDFGCLDLVEPTGATLVPQLPFSTKELSLSAGDLRHSFPFLPSIDSGLKHFFFIGNSTNDGHSLLALIQLLSPTLESIAVCLWSSWKSPCIHTYGTLHNGPPLLLESIKLLSSLALNSLTLSDTHGPSLRLLRQLVISCPLLEHLSFHHSCWVSDNNPSSTVPEEVFPEDEILETLEEFEVLQYVDFGWLPTEDVAKYLDLEEALTYKLGVNVEYQVCEAEEVNV
ncbi:hypothetical protein JCM5353_008886 [Sporobolomyces roseus]